MHGAKLLGQRLSARDLDRRVAAFRVRAAVLAGFTAPGTPIAEAKGQVPLGKAKLWPSADLRDSAVRDGNLITGQGQFSGGAAAELVVQTLGR
jgi:putative intracellular protease/amidase